MDNPINMIDPDGRAPDWIFDQLADGSYKRREGVANDGGENFHTYIDGDGTTRFYDVKKNTLTLAPSEAKLKHQAANRVASRKRALSVAKETGDFLNNAGDLVSTTGYVAAPFTEGTSMILPLVGEPISLLGKVISNSANIAMQGQTPETTNTLMIDLAVEVAPAPLESLIGNFGLDKAGKAILLSEVGKVKQATEVALKADLESIVEDQQTKPQNDTSHDR